MHPAARHLVAGLVFACAAVPAFAQDPTVIIAEKTPEIEIEISVDAAAAGNPFVLEALTADAQSITEEARTFATNDYAERGQEDYWNPHYLNAFYATEYRNEEVASILSTRDTYAGGAHGLQVFVTFLFDLTSEEPVGADALFGDFSDTSEAFTAIQGFVRERVAADRAERLQIPELPPEDLDWVHEGTMAPDDLSAFTLVPSADDPSYASGLKIYLGPYQVGSYAEGSYEVEVPALVFADYLSADWADTFDTGQ